LTPDLRQLGAGRVREAPVMPRVFMASKPFVPEPAFAPSLE
jgi:hypothetical protein